MEYPFQGINKSRYSIGESVWNNNFIIIISKDAGIVSLIILQLLFMVTVQLLQLQFGPSFMLRCFTCSFLLSTCSAQDASITLAIAYAASQCGMNMND